MQVTLDEDRQRRARKRAAELGISISELLRRGLDTVLAEPDRPKAHISEIFGIGHSGGSDIATFKDQYIGEAVEAAYLEKTRRRAR